MKIINSFKKTFLFTFCLLFFSAHTHSITLEKTPVSLNNPWGELGGRSVIDHAKIR